MTYSSPSRRARVFMAEGSEPACASERQYAPSSSPPNISGSHFLPLLLRAGRGKSEAGQRVHGDPDPDTRPDCRDLLDHLEVDLVGLRATAVLLRVGQSQQAGASQGPERLPGEGLGRFGVGSQREQLALCDLAHQVDQRGGLLCGEHACGRHAFHPRTSRPTPPCCAAPRGHLAALCQSPWLRHGSLLRLAMHSAGHRSRRTRVERHVLRSVTKPVLGGRGAHAWPCTMGP